MRALAIPFRISNGAVAETKNYDDIVRWQVLDCAATNLGERVMRPQWGINARDYLYNPSSSLERNDTAGVVKAKLATSVPRAAVTNVGISTDDLSPNLVTIEIRYKSSRFVGATDNTVSITTTTTPTGGTTV